MIHWRTIFENVFHELPGTLKVSAKGALTVLFSVFMMQIKDQMITIDIVLSRVSVFVTILVSLATLIYIVVKIRNELKRKGDDRRTT